MAEVLFDPCLLEKISLKPLDSAVFRRYNTICVH